MFIFLFEPFVSKTSPLQAAHPHQSSVLATLTPWPHTSRLTHQASRIGLLHFFNLTINISTWVHFQFFVCITSCGLVYSRNNLFRKLWDSGSQYYITSSYQESWLVSCYPSMCVMKSQFLTNCTGQRGILQSPRPHIGPISLIQK